VLHPWCLKECWASRPNIQRKTWGSCLPFCLKDDIELVDLTDRAIRENKHGYIDNQLPFILGEFHISSREWLVPSTQSEATFKCLVGCKAKLLHAEREKKIKEKKREKETVTLKMSYKKFL